MKFLLPFFLFLLIPSCSAKMVKATEDAIEGEIKVVGDVVTDLAHEGGVRSRPCIQFTVAKF